MKCLMNRFSSRLGMREERISKHEDGSIEIAQLKDRRGKKKGGNLILCLCVCVCVCAHVHMCVCVHACTCAHVCTHLCGFKGQLASEAGACQFSAHRLPANPHFSLALLCWYLVPCTRYLLEILQGNLTDFSLLCSTTGISVFLTLISPSPL